MDILNTINAMMRDLIFQKCDIKEQYVIYGASILAVYGNDKKCYFLVFVPIHLAILDKAYLYELPWQNFQSRIMPGIYRLQSQRWNLPEDVEDIKFNLSKREKMYTSYTPVNGDNFTLLLLHDNKKKSIFQHYNHTTLIKAIGSYACVLNYEGDTLYSPIQQPHQVQQAQSFDYGDSKPKKYILNQALNSQNQFMQSSSVGTAKSNMEGSFELI
jgi:hypothetical protein